MFILTSTFICSLSLELSILKWAFGKPSTVVSLWLVMKAMALFAFPIFSAWHANRHSWLPLPDLFWLLLYIIYLTVFAIFPVQEVIQHNLPPASSIIILAEQVRSVAQHWILYFVALLFDSTGASDAQIFLPRNLLNIQWICILPSP